MPTKYFTLLVELALASIGRFRKFNYYLTLLKNNHKKIQNLGGINNGTRTKYFSL